MSSDPPQTALPTGTSGSTPHATPLRARRLPWQDLAAPLGVAAAAIAVLAALQPLAASLVSEDAQRLVWVCGVALTALSVCVAAWITQNRRYAQARRACAQLQAQLAERDTRLVSLMGLADLAYFERDDEGRYTRIQAPAHWEEALRLSALIGQHPWDQGSALNDDGHWDAHQQSLSQHASYKDLQIRRINAQGRAFVMNEAAVPLQAPDGAVAGWSGVMRDITAEQQLRRERAIALAALEACGEAVLLISAAAESGWRVGWANTAASRLFDRSAAELATLHDGTLLGENNRMLAQRLEDALRAGCGLKMQLAITDRYAQPVNVRLRLDPLPGGPGLASMGVVTLDASGPELEDLRRGMVEAKRHRQQAHAQALEHEVLARELESFSYTVSHDLRAPLRVIEGFVRIVREDYARVLDAMGAEHLDRVLTAASRMNTMIDALLSMSRLASRPIVPERVDLSRLAASVCEDLMAAAPQRQVRTQIETDLETLGDAALLRVVLQNLIGNAFKYSEPLACSEISFEAQIEEGRTVYCVRDNGVGFDMRYADKLFNPFQRLHSADEFPGTGIGLASVQRIIRRHGGRIWAHSEPGQGAQFYFTLGETASPDSF
jgi:signal transduction histidine kinase